MQSEIAGKNGIGFSPRRTRRETSSSKPTATRYKNLWQNCIFGLCGITNFTRRNFESVIMSTLEERKQWLTDLRENNQKNTYK